MEGVVNMNVNPMETCFDINQIIQLIGTLYNSRDTVEQAEANRKLSELQSSQEAWQICWLLLDPYQNISMEAQFFSAQMLLLKINQSWLQQDPEWLENHLRPKLLETLVKHASSNTADKLVIDRLALALANFALHSIPTFWPNAIENILQSFTPQNLPVTVPPQRICDILLKILMYIPEEFSVMMPQQNVRAKLNSQMTKSGPIVFKFLHSLLISSNEAINSECRQSLLKCLTSWTLHSGSSLLEVDGGITLLNQLFDLIEDEELCSTACAALAASLSNQKSESYRNSIIEFIPKIAKLRQVVEKYKMEDDLENVIKIYSLVINFSENHSRLLLKIVLNDGIQLASDKEEPIKQGVFTIISTILDSTSAPGTYGVDEKYSDISFTFWFTFFENFYYYSDSFNDKICETFNPLVDSLLRTLITKSQYPSSATYYQVWKDDERESYRCYRQDLGDNISLIIHFPRARDRILVHLYDQLSHELMELQRSEPVNGEKPWQRFESIAFALKSISENVPFDESKYVGKMIEILTQVPYNETHALLYCTVAELMSAYSDWLYSHTTHLPAAYNILFLGVNSSDSHVRLMSTLSLKDITSECQPVLHPLALNIVKSCTEAVLNPESSLTTNEKSRLMHTIGTSLAVSSTSTIMSSLNTLTVPLIRELEIKSQTNPNVDPSYRDDIFDRLSMLNSLIESLYVKQYSGNDYEDGDENDHRVIDVSRYEAIGEIDISQPALELLKNLIPTLNVIASNYQSDENIIEIITNTIKRSAKSLGVELKPVLKDLLTLVVNVYDPLVNSIVLDGSIPLYSLFKSDSNLNELFRESFKLISEKTLKVCLENSLRTLSLTLENYFKYATLACKRIPAILVDQSSIINTEYIYKLAIASLELPEKRTLAEVCSFLCHFRQASIGSDHLNRIFISNLDIMLANIFNIFGGTYSTPRNAIENVTDLLFAILESDHAKEPLKVIVAKDDFPTSFVSRDQKSRFVCKIVHEKNRRKFKDACLEFVLVARNLNRS